MMSTSHHRLSHSRVSKFEPFWAVRELTAQSIERRVALLQFVLRMENLADFTSHHARTAFLEAIGVKPLRDKATGKRHVGPGVEVKSVAEIDAYLKTAFTTDAPIVVAWRERNNLLPGNLLRLEFRHWPTHRPILHRNLRTPDMQSEALTQYFAGDPRRGLAGRLLILPRALSFSLHKLRSIRPSDDTFVAPLAANLSQESFLDTFVRARDLLNFHLVKDHGSDPAEVERINGLTAIDPTLADSIWVKDGDLPLQQGRRVKEAHGCTLVARVKRDAQTPAHAVIGPDSRVIAWLQLGFNPSRTLARFDEISRLANWNEPQAGDFEAARAIAAA